MTERALYDAQLDLHGPDYLQDLVGRFSAGHEMKSLASQLNADYSVPAELEPKIERVATTLSRGRKRSKESVLKSLKRIKVGNAKAAVSNRTGSITQVGEKWVSGAL